MMMYFTYGLASNCQYWEGGFPSAAAKLASHFLFSYCSCPIFFWWVGIKGLLVSVNELVILSLFLFLEKFGQY